MWYRISQVGLEEKILRGDAENAIRRRLYMTGDYNPTQEKVTRLTKRVMEKLLEKYSTYNVIRHHVQGESLSPAVNAVVDEILKLKN